MKQALGWWWPDHETHLIEWMQHPQNAMVLNGRQAYQGKKQVAAIDAAALVAARAGRTKLRTAVDVGGHVGLWSWNLAQAFEQVHAFEPVETMRECFVRNVISTSVQLHPVALGEHEASIAMSTDPKSTGDSRVCGQGQIPMRTLDSYELGTVDLIKVDCEGYEEKVLRGAVETIRRCMPALIVEQKRDMATRFGLKPRGAVEFLHGLGYELKQEIGGDFIMVPA